MSSVENPGWLGYIRDEILPSYGGDYFISQYTVSLLTNQDFMECRSRVFITAQVASQSWTLREKNHHIESNVKVE